MTACLCALTVWWSCAPDDEPPAAFERHFTDRLTILHGQYTGLELSEALAEAYQLLGELDTVTTEVNPSHRAELYQYLSLLHFDRETALDSIGYYAAAAETLLTAASPPRLRARQALCWAYASYHDWAMQEMELYTAYGLSLLDERDKGDAYLRGSLLVARARATKQLGDQVRDALHQRATWRRSEELFTAAMKAFSFAGSPRRMQVYEELAVLLSRMPDRRADFYASVAAYRREAAAAPAGLYDPARGLGYYHSRMNNADSAIYYYRQLIATEGHFFEGYYLEGFYALRALLREADRFDEALAVSADVTRYYGCCSVEALLDRPQPGGADVCFDDPRCVFVLHQHGDILLQRYLAEHSGSDLASAFAGSQLALRKYATAFARISKEGVFNQVIHHGDDMIATAIEAAFLAHENGPRADSAVLQGIFNAVEFGKSHSLVMELLQADKGSADRSTVREAEVERDVDLLKRQAAAGNELSVRELQRFTELLAERRALAAGSVRSLTSQRKALNQSYGVPEQINEVQQELSATEALVEFLETERGIYGLYLDRDTVLVYRITSSVRDRVEQFRALIQDPATVPAIYQRAGRLLYDQLFGPVASVIGKRTDLLISPSASLSALPFAALVRQPSATPPEFLVHNYALRYIDSWRAYRLLGRGVARTEGKGGTRVGVWTHPFLQNYLGAVADRLMDAPQLSAVLYTNAGATATTLLEEAHRYDWLHLSVHARGNPRRLHDNYLYVNIRDSINGVQISALDLNCQLVVLAACATDLGRTERREGTYSLRRSFHRAGVPYVVASQFDIPAAATAELLQLFYDRLLAGAPPHRSLAWAQQQLCSARLGARWRHPAYWAGLMVA